MCSFILCPFISSWKDVQTVSFLPSFFSVLSPMLIIKELSSANDFCQCEMVKDHHNVIAHIYYQVSHKPLRSTSKIVFILGQLTFTVLIRCYKLLILLSCLARNCNHRSTWGQLAFHYEELETVSARG